MSKQDKFTRSARDHECLIRIPGVCNHNPETSVLCHLAGGGMGLKQPNIHAAIGCSACHDEVDGRTRRVKDRLAVRLYHHEGVIRTQQFWIREGLL